MSSKPTHSPEDHLRAARLALDNARALAEDADLLLNANRPARALALSVIGAEEAGKALLHGFAVLDLASNVVREFDSRRWTSPLSNHLFKQLAVDMIGGADSTLDANEMAAAGELTPYLEPERTARIILGCASTLSDMYADNKGVAAGKTWLEGVRSMIPRMKHLPPWESSDEEKMRGLYVDLVRAAGQPHEVGYSQARSRLEDLRGTIRILDHYGRCLSEEARWQELVDEVGFLRDE